MNLRKIVLFFCILELLTFGIAKAENGHHFVEASAKLGYGGFLKSGFNLGYYLNDQSILEISTQKGQTETDLYIKNFFFTTTTNVETFTSQELALNFKHFFTRTDLINLGLHRQEIDYNMVNCGNSDCATTLSNGHWKGHVTHLSVGLSQQNYALNDNLIYGIEWFTLFIPIEKQISSESYSQPSIKNQTEVAESKDKFLNKINLQILTVFLGMAF